MMHVPSSVQRGLRKGTASLCPPGFPGLPEAPGSDRLSGLPWARPAGRLLLLLGTRGGGWGPPTPSMPVPPSLSHTQSVFQKVPGPNHRVIYLPGAREEGCERRVGAATTRPRGVPGSAHSPPLLPGLGTPQPRSPLRTPATLIHPLTQAQLPSRDVTPSVPAVFLSVLGGQDCARLQKALHLRRDPRARCHHSPLLGSDPREGRPPPPAPRTPRSRTGFPL